MRRGTGRATNRRLQANQKIGWQVFFREGETTGSSSSRQVEQDLDWRVKINRSNRNMERLLARLCELVQRHDGTAVQFGEDIEVLLDL